MTHEEFGVAVDKYRAAMVDKAALYVSNRTVAADIVGQAMEKTAKHYRRLTRNGFGQYFFMAVRCASLDYLELHRHAWEVPVFETDEGSPLIEPMTSPNDAVRLDIVAAFRQLPMELRGVAIQIHIEEWTQEEVAKQRQCSQTSIYRMMEDINTRLRSALAAYKTGRAA